MPTLMIIIASTRPGRVGEAIGEWFVERARERGGFDLDVVDLAALGLPLMNEPQHPRLQEYEHDHTKAWSARVEAADVIVLVMPEYNHGYTAPLKNALDYLGREWNRKPVGFVSYGGISGGTRAVQLLKPVLACLQLVPASAAVAIPFVGASMDDGLFQPDAPIERAATAMLNELTRLDAALAPLRA